MDRPETGVRVMSDVTITNRTPPGVLRLIWRKHAAKRASTALGVAYETARKYLVDGVPLSRRRALAKAVQLRIRELEDDIATLRTVEQQLEGGHDR